MCTAITYQTKDHYFGRNLDLEYSYDESVTITPRHFPLSFRELQDNASHYAMIGMATVADSYPLYYDATNEKGLSMAALNFPDNAVYPPVQSGKDNIAPFELIPWILAGCATVQEAKALLSNAEIAKIQFSPAFPLTPLHWLLADQTEAVTIEAVADGLKIYENPVGVLTNNPPFPMQLFNLNNYMHLSEQNPKNTFAPDLPLRHYSRGMGSLGLPGDLTSSSRFVRAAFTKFHSVCGDTESESISQFFHILYAAAQKRGCVQVGEDYEITRYSSCCNTDKGIYYYTTYENFQITAVDMHRENLDSNHLISYPLRTGQRIFLQNCATEQPNPTPLRI